MFFFGLVIAFLIFIRSQPNINKIKVLNKRIIIVDSLIGQRLVLFLFSLIFFLFGIWGLIFSDTIEGKFFASLLIVIQILLCIKSLKQICKILTNNYKVQEDILINKEVKSEINPGQSAGSWINHCYFKFKKYKKKVRVYNKKYITSNINDKFYIVVIDGKDCLVEVYNAKYYILKE